MAFKIYGYSKDKPDGPIVEISLASLCFSDLGEVLRFEKFVSDCRKGIEEHENWDHEDFFEENGKRDYQIVLGLLDPRNK